MLAALPVSDPLLSMQSPQRLPGRSIRRDRGVGVIQQVLGRMSLLAMCTSLPLRALQYTKSTADFCSYSLYCAKAE